MGTIATLEQLKQDAFSGALGKASAATLGEYAAALCHSQAFSVFGAHEFPQISETVRIHLLRAHIEALQAHITELDAKNTSLSRLVVALTVAALLVGIPQIWFAYKADKRSEQETKTVAAPQPAPPTPSASQSHAARPTASPSTPRKP